MRHVTLPDETITSVLAPSPSSMSSILYFESTCNLRNPLNTRAIRESHQIPFKLSPLSLYRVQIGISLAIILCYTVLGRETNISILPDSLSTIDGISVPPDQFVYQLSHHLC